jgi:hypothetical protein
MPSERRPMVRSAFRAEKENLGLRFSEHMLREFLTPTGDPSDIQTGEMPIQLQTLAQNSGLICANRLAILQQCQILPSSTPVEVYMDRAI